MSKNKKPTDFRSIATEWKHKNFSILFRFKNLKTCIETVLEVLENLHRISKGPKDDKVNIKENIVRFYQLLHVLHSRIQSKLNMNIGLLCAEEPVLGIGTIRNDVNPIGNHSWNEQRHCESEHIKMSIEGVLKLLEDCRRESRGPRAVLTEYQGDMDGFILFLKRIRKSF